MKIEAGQKVQIFCLSDKPEGTVISVGDKTVKIEISRGILTVDKDDMVEGTAIGSNSKILKVLNYTNIEEKKEEIEESISSISEEMTDQFVSDMKKTVKALEKDN